MKEIDSELFKNLPDLEEIDFSNNKINYLPSELFQNSNKLKSIDFSFNQIEELSGNVFDGLGNLMRISLSNNGIKNLGNILKDQKSLKLADFKNNQIVKIHPGLREIKSFTADCAKGRGDLKTCYDSWNKSVTEIESGEKNEFVNDFYKLKIPFI